MSFYVLISWLGANILHPLLILIFWNIAPTGFFFENIMFCVYLTVLSVPSLVTGVVLAQVLVKIRWKPIYLLLLWVICCPVLVMINLSLISMFISGSVLDNDMLMLGQPAMVAAVAASLICSPYYFKVANKTID